MTGEETAWAAGLFDGEGHIGFVGKHSVVMQLGMTDEDVVRRFHTVVGVGRLSGPYSNGPRGRKPVWLWAAQHTPDVRELLVALKPWLGERRSARADAALARCANVAVRPRLSREIVHGTLAGYQKERYRGLAPCPECSRANREYRNEHNARRRAKKNQANAPTSEAQLQEAA